MLPPKSDERWKKIIEGKYNSSLKNLGAKILTGRLFLTYLKEPKTIDTCIDELYEYLQTNSDAAAEDIKNIFG